jgi:hypothetical protein
MLEGMRGFKPMAAAFTVILGVVAVLAAPSHVSAEYDSTKQSSYGVETKGGSTTIALWNALTWEYEQVGNRIFVGGNYLDIVDETGTIVGRQPYLSTMDATTGKWESWFRPDVGNAVFAMQVSPDGGLFVGGEMGTWNGQAVGALVKIDPATGELWPGFDTHLTGGVGTVRDIQLEDDGWLYIGGGFTTVTHNGASIAQSGAVRVNPLTGSVDTSWTPQVTEGSVWGISRSKTQDLTYLAGHFDFVNGESGTAGFVSVNEDGEVEDKRDAVPFNGCFGFGGYCTEMYDVVATPQGDVWVGGVEHSLYVLDESSDLDMKWHHYSGCDPTKNDECFPDDWFGGEFQEIELIGDRIYATCHCWFDLYSSQNQVLVHSNRSKWQGIEGVDFFHQTINGVMAFDPVTGTVIPSFVPLLGGDAGGFGVHVNESDGCLWVAGGFSSYGLPGGAQPPAFDVVRLCDETGAGPPAGPPSTPPVALGCAASNVGTAATVDFALPEGAVRAVIYRSLNGGNYSWRGAVDVPATDFSDTVPNGSVIQYQVRAKYEADQLSAPLTCDPAIDLQPSLQPVPSCSAVANSNNQPVITWQSANDAVDYVISRSVNGTGPYWRGKVDAGSLIFTDSVMPFNVAYTYSIVSKDVNGTSAASTVCTPNVSATAPDLGAVPSCSAVIGAGNKADITWDAAANAIDYIIYRSVNGSARYWQGKVQTTSYSSSGALQSGKTYQYDVVAVGADGTRAAQTLCAPALSLQSPQVSAPTVCNVTVDGNGAVTVIWSGAQNAVKYVVRRSANGGTFFWRGAITNGTETFSDTITDNRNYVYRVDAVGSNNAVASVSCPI